jgi:hypothetical protein
LVPVSPLVVDGVGGHRATIDEVAAGDGVGGGATTIIVVSGGWLLLLMRVGT